MAEGKMNIKPILLYLSESQDRYSVIKKHLEENGIHDVLEVNGINAEAFGIDAIRPYTRDFADSTYIQPSRKTGCTLSHFMLYTVMNSHPEIEHWFLIEDDCLFLDGWKDKLEYALANDVPKDFDFLFVGSCCTQGRESIHVSGDVYELKYPLCCHAMIISKKVLPLLIEKCRDGSQPIDVLLFDRVFPQSKVYTILPRLVTQRQELPV